MFIGKLAILLGKSGGMCRLEQLDRLLLRWRRHLDARRRVLDAMLAVTTREELPALFQRAVSTRDMDVAEAAATRIEVPETAAASIAAADWLVYNGNILAATSLYESALAAEPVNPRALLGMAVVSLDRADSRGAMRFARRAARKLPAPVRPTLAPFIRAASELWAERAPIAVVDTLFFCHATRKLTKNLSLGPPGIGLLSTAVTSWRTQMRAVGRAIVMYDHRPGDEAFRDNLERFCRAEGLELIVNQSNGLRKQWLAAFAAVTGDAALVIEQDHEFLPNCPTVRQMIDVLDARPDLGHIRLNRRSTIRIRLDLALEQGGRDAADGVVRTSKFSNTPHLIRRDYFDAIVQPMICDVSHRDTNNSGAAGVEETINHFLVRAEAVIGLPAIMRLAGTAIWGKLDDPRVAVHTGV